MKTKKSNTDASQQSRFSSTMTADSTPAKGPETWRPRWEHCISLGGECLRAKSLQSCPILCDPTDCSPPGSSVHADSPGKNAAVGSHPSSRDSSRSRHWTHVSYISCVGRQVLYHQRHLDMGSKYVKTTVLFHWIPLSLHKQNHKDILMSTVDMCVESRSPAERDKSDMS